MSIAKIHAFTTWINLRLNLHEDDCVKDVLVDFFQGYHWMNLLESYTGRCFDRVGSFNDASQVQKADKIEFFIKELKSWNILDNEISIKPKYVAARSAEDTFALLFNLVCFDIQFLWDRKEYLQCSDNKELSKYPFSLFPEKIIEERKQFKMKRNLLGGLGENAVTYESLTKEKEIKAIYPFEEKMIKCNENDDTKKSISTKYRQRLVSIVKSHFKISKFGKGVKFEKLTDFADITVLCALINVIIPLSFSPNILPNDQWSINLILKSIEKMVRIKSDFDAADLNSGDIQAISVYIITLLIAIYQTRQKWIVLNYLKDLKYEIRKLKFESESLIDNVETTFITSKIEHLIEEQENLSDRFDLSICKNYVILRETILKETTDLIRFKIRTKFEIVKVIKNTNVSDFCNRMMVSKYSGFCKIKLPEMINGERQIILFDKMRNKYYGDDQMSSNKVNTKIKALLKVQNQSVFIVDPRDHENFEIYIECVNKSKSLSFMDYYLYKVFDSVSPNYWLKLLHKAAKDNDFVTVSCLLKLFNTSNMDRDLIWADRKDLESGNSALHYAVEGCHYKMVAYLLEYGFCNVNIQNNYKMTPLFVAVNGMHEKITRLLLEWGADISIINIRKQTVMDICLNNNIKKILSEKSELYTSNAKSISSGDTERLQKLVSDMKLYGYDQYYLSLRSRCIEGSTLLHSSGHFGLIDVIKDLLSMKIDVNIRDYLGASVLHRTMDIQILKLLIEADADVNLPDNHLNYPLHTVCFENSQSNNDLIINDQLEKIQLLLNNGADPIAQNKNGFLPIHFAALKGHWEIIAVMLDGQTGDIVRENLNYLKDSSNPPSLVHQSIYGGHISCALKLLDAGFSFKAGESSQLLTKLVNRELKIHGNFQEMEEAMDLLITNSQIDINGRLPPQNKTILHLAATTRDFPELIQFLIKKGADVNITDGEHSTALFDACKNNNIQSAKILIENDVNIAARNQSGLTAFDFISDYDEWINFELFDYEIIARLKAYKLKHTRTTLQNIHRSVNSDSEPDSLVHLHQLEYRLDQCLIEDIVERSRSQLTLRARSALY